MFSDVLKGTESVHWETNPSMKHFFDNINPFLSNALFLYPLKTTGNFKAFEKNELNQV